MQRSLPRATVAWLEAWPCPRSSKAHEHPPVLFFTLPIFSTTAHFCKCLIKNDAWNMLLKPTYSLVCIYFLWNSLRSKWTRRLLLLQFTTAKQFLLSYKKQHNYINRVGITASLWVTLSWRALQPTLTWRSEMGGPQSLPASLKPGVDSRNPRTFVNVTILCINLTGDWTSWSGC